MRPRTAIFYSVDVGPLFGELLECAR